MISAFVHQLYKSTGHICQPEWHDQPFIQLFLCIQHCLPLISITNLDLMVFALQVNLCEVLDPTQTIHQVIHSWQWNQYLMVVLLTALESVHIVHSPPFFSASIVGIALGSISLSYESSVQQLLDLSINLLTLCWSQLVWCFVW